MEKFRRQPVGMLFGSVLGKTQHHPSQNCPFREGGIWTQSNTRFLARRISIGSAIFAQHTAVTNTERHKDRDIHATHMLRSNRRPSSYHCESSSTVLHFWYRLTRVVPDKGVLLMLLARRFLSVSAHVTDQSPSPSASLCVRVSVCRSVGLSRKCTVAKRLSGSGCRFGW